jgi:hypothetical protein
VTVGEACQRLIHALILFHGLSAAKINSRDVADLNSLLYVVIGGPALQPLVKVTPPTPRADAPAN